MKTRLCTLALALCSLYAGSASAERDFPPQNLRLNIGVTGSGDKMASLRPNEFDSSSRTGFDALPWMSSHPLRSTQADGFLPPDRSIAWGRLDVDELPNKSAEGLTGIRIRLPARVETQAEAWDAAYALLASFQQKDGNASALTQFIGQDRQLYVIEPVVDLVDEKAEERLKRLEAPAVQQMSLTAPAATPPSSVWGKGEPGWHLVRTQLHDAYASVFCPSDNAGRQASCEPTRPGSVWVAHLDTGYLDKTVSLPKYFDTDLSRECTKEGCKPGGAAKWESAKWPSSPQHGTATLSNLAGNQPANGDTKVAGGNPGARVFSIRINDFVVHLDSRRMAQGIREAVNNKADVITMSHGGAPSRMLVEAVNYAYTEGTALFAATGDFFEVPLFGWRTFRSVVYPARYARVMGVAGATYDNTSYGLSPKNPFLVLLDFGSGYWYRLGSWMLRGNYGPASVMDRNVISGYSPNITRSLGHPDAPGLIGHDGAGTSHSTPQVAAAASLWLEQNKPKFSDEKWRSWEKSEAVYAALRASATPDFPSYSVKHFGKGILQANSALKWTYSEEATAVQNGPDQLVRLSRAQEADRDLLGLAELLTSAKLPGRDPLRQALINMLTTELQQVIFRSRPLQHFLEQREPCSATALAQDCAAPALSESETREMVSLVQASPIASQTLKRLLADAVQGKTLDL